MTARVTQTFKGRAAGSQQCITYKVGDIITDARVAAAAIRSKRAVPVSAAKAPGPAGKEPAENKAHAGPADNKGGDGGGGDAGAGEGAEAPGNRDPRQAAPQPVPLRGNRPGRG